MKRLLLLIIGCTFFYFFTNGQPYPVTTSLVIANPTLSNLDEQTLQNSNTIFNTLLLTDGTKPTYEVLLKMRISGNGIVMEHNLPVKTAFLLTLNVPEILTGPDLSILLSAYELNTNTNFQGITLQNYINNGLPDGNYEVCITAYDVEVSAQVSNQGCSQITIANEQSPEIISPIGNIPELPIANYELSWLPRHVGGLASYEVRIYESILGLTPDQVVSYTTPMYQATTLMTTHYYTSSDPVLVLGQEYYIQVQIEDLTGKYAFLNNGNSEIETFKIGAVAGCTEGAPCDDSDPCTENDQFTIVENQCFCVGTPLPDSDGDGVCDDQDICPNGNDNIDANNNGIPDDCEGCSVGSTCDDGDDCTENDQIDPDCNCVGNLVDGNTNDICDFFEPPVAPIAYEVLDLQSTSFIANWSSVSGATSYQFDLATDAAFTNYVSGYESLSVNELQITITDVDFGNHTYFYRLRAINDISISGHSNVVEVSPSNLEPPIAYEAVDVTGVSFSALWSNVSLATHYRLEVSLDEAFTQILPDYNDIEVDAQYRAVTELDNDNKYYYRVRAKNDFASSDYSNVIEVTLRNGCELVQIEEIPYVCGDDTPVNLDNYDLITDLEKGDTIWAGDFLIELTKVNGNGPFIGEGKMNVPFFELAQVNVKFNGISVAENCRMVDGYMQVTGVGLGLLPEELSNAIDDFLTTLDDIDNVLGQVEQLLDAVMDVLNNSEIIDDYFADGFNIFNGAGQLQEEYPYMPDSLVTNLQEAMDCFGIGNLQQCKEELVDALTDVQQYLQELYNADFQIVFNKNDTQLYGFDKLIYEAHKDNYNKIEIAKEDYFVPWKSVASILTDEAHAQHKMDIAFPNNIRFEDTNKNIISHSAVQGTNKVNLEVNGLMHEEINPIYPVQFGQDSLGNPELHYAGKLNVIAYDQLHLDVVLVPVNGYRYPYSVTTLQENLSKIYQQAVVSVGVDTSSNLLINDFNNIIDSTASGFLSAYNWEMKDVIHAFENEEDVDKDKYYLFLVQGNEDANKLAYMPKKRQFGFLYTSHFSSEEEFTKVIAHELGHGAFILDHTFETYSEDLPKESTNNLMDYGVDSLANGAPGIHLHKYQWDLIHNPASNFTLFDDEEEGDYVTVNIMEIIEPEWITNGFVSFIDPKGEIISFQESLLKNVTFATGGEVVENLEIPIPIGTLTHFMLRESPGSQASVEYHFDFLGETYRDLQSNEYIPIPFPPDTDTIPMAVRHCRINNANAIHLVTDLDYNQPTLNIGEYPSYDYLMPSFFVLDGATDWAAWQPENVFQNTSSEKYMNFSEEFGGQNYLNFLEEFNNIDGVDYADYNELSSFYLGSFAVMVEKWDQYVENCEAQSKKTRLIYALVKNTFGFAPSGLGPELFSSYEDETDFINNTFQTLFNSSFLTDAGLSQSDVINTILAALTRSPLIQYYNVLLTEIPINESKIAEFLINVINDDYQKQLFSCEFDQLQFDSYEQIETLIKRQIESNFNDYIPETGTSYWLDNSEEWLILKLMEKIEILFPEQQVDFLTFIENEILPGTNNKRYWAILAEGVDDSWFDDNGKALIEKFNRFYKYTGENYPFSSIGERIGDLSSKINTVFNEGSNTINYEYLADNPLPIIPYDYKNFLARVKWEMTIPCLLDGASVSYQCLYYLWNLIPNTKVTEVKINESLNEINVLQLNKLVFANNGANPYGTYYEPGFKPFDPIILDNSSTYSLVEEVVPDGSFQILPAFVLFYLEESASNQTASDLTFTAIDLVTLFIPITKVGWLGKMIGYMDKASSVLSIAGTYSQDVWTTETTNALNFTSAILGFADLGHNGWLKLKGISAGNQSAGKLLSILNKNYIVDTNNNLQAQNYGNLLDYIESLTDDKVLKISGKAKDFIVRVLNSHKSNNLNKTYLGTNGLNTTIDETAIFAILAKLNRTEAFFISQQIETALKNLNPSIPGSELPSKVITLITDIEELKALRDILVTNDKILKAFHDAVGTGYPDLVEFYKYIKNSKPDIFDKIFGLSSNSFDIVKREQFFDDLSESSTLRQWFWDGDWIRLEAWEAVENFDLATNTYALGKVTNAINQGTSKAKIRDDLEDVINTGDEFLKTKWIETIDNNNFIVLRRGTDAMQELQDFTESGYLLSDAARAKFYESGGDLDVALNHANNVHVQWLNIFNGDINAYAQAHALNGTEMESIYGLKRTLISTTADRNLINNFYTPGIGDKFIGILEKNKIIEQTLNTSTENEYLVIVGTSLFKKIN